MAFDNNSEMSRMQQDAIRRVQEMQSRAQQNIRGTTRDTHYEPPHPPEPTRQALPDPPLEHPAANPITDIFQTLMQDSERTLILVLLLLLLEEKSDTELIFALMYLIM